MNPNTTYRLCKHADYQFAYKAGRKQHAKNIAYFYAARPAERRSATAGARVGLTVPKALGGAVDRNRIKRRLREAVRHNLPLLATAGAIDVILHPRRVALTMEFTALEREVGTIFRAISKVAAPRARPELRSHEQRQTSPEQRQASPEQRQTSHEQKP